MDNSSAANNVTVRLASTQDAERVAVLCQQLGYTATWEDVQRRLCQVQRDEQHAVYVAEALDGQVVGWVHVHVRQSLVVERHAEIGGLVVDEDFRGCGAGQLLMRQAERWACDRDCGAVYVRSNVIRQGAHAFYKRIGYDRVKTQFKFDKIIHGGEEI